MLPVAGPSLRSALSVASKVVAALLVIKLRLTLLLLTRQVVVSGACGPAAPAAAYSPSSQMHAWAAVLDESSFHTPPRGLSRTYSEDEEVRSN